MANKKSAAELRAENRILRSLRASEGFISVVNNVVRWGGLVWIVYYIQGMVVALAGKETIANIGMSFLGDVRISEALAWLLAGGTTLYGLSQRKLRKDTVERLQGRIHRHEVLQDPKRSSSKLTPRGDTPPEDGK